MLYYCPRGWINGEVMTADLKVEIGHLRITLCKQIRIFPQADLNLLSCQVGESSANLHPSAWVFTERDELEVPIRNWSEGHLLAVGGFILVEASVQQDRVDLWRGPLFLYSDGQWL